MIAEKISSMTTIGEWLKLARAKAKLTQAELADRLTEMGHPYAKNTIGGWETTSRLPPIDDPSFTSTLAAILGVSEIEIYEVAGVFSPSSNVAVQKLVQLAGVLSPSEIEQIESFMKFLISSRSNRRENK
jgi:transcriptional regulator with XRE-family HTH domain